MLKHLVVNILMRIFVIESLTKPTSHDHADHHRFFCSSLFGACLEGRGCAGFKSTIMKNEFTTVEEARKAAKKEMESWGSNLVFLGVREGVNEDGEPYFYNAYNVFD